MPAVILNSWAGRWWPTWLTGLICLMSTEKPEKVKITKDDKNRLARKLTSVPPTTLLLLSSYSPPESNTLQTSPSLPVSLPWKKQFINSLEQGARGKAAQEG